MLIELSELNIKLLLLLIFPVFIQLQDATKKKYMIKDNQIFKTFRYFSCYIFAGLFFIIFKIRNRKSSIKESEIINNIEAKETYVDEFIKKNKRKKTIFNILFIALLCGVGMFCQYYSKLFEKKVYRNAKQSILIIFYIFSLSLLSYFILKLKLYRHHYISSVIMLIVLLTMFILSIPYVDLIFQVIIFYLFYSILFSVYDVLKKKYMNIYYHTPYSMMLIIGSINSTILIIFDIIAYYSNRDISGIIIGFNDNINSVGDFFLLILDLFLECI